MTLHFSSPTSTTHQPVGTTTTHSPEIRGVGLTKAYGRHQVFEDVSFVAAPGHRLGVIGENGAGKSTLLGIVTGAVDPDLGTVRRPTGTAHLHQELPIPGSATVEEVIAEALAPARRLEAELERTAQALAAGTAGSAEAYAAVLAAAERCDVWNADRRATTVTDGLGLGHIAAYRAVGSLSGGERTRLELATILIAAPPALVLDEPTNHLDDEAIDFLTSHLRTFAGPVLLASHDRLFLEQVCTGLVDLDPTRGARTYGGSFEHYLVQRERDRARWAQQWAAEQDELAALRHAATHTAPNVSHFRARPDNDKMQYDYKGGRVNHQIARRIRNTRGRIETLEAAQVAKPPTPLRFVAPPPIGTPNDGPLLGAAGIGVTDRLRPTDLSVGATTKLLVTGRNGAGKSTLLGVLASRITPDTGTCAGRRGLRVGYLPQDVTFPDDARTPQQVFAAVARSRSLVDLGLLSGRDLTRPVGELSVGQRRRVALGCLVASRPHVLLLDEPTNHLSLALAEELEDALMTSLGAVVVASHDRWLRRRWDGEELHLEPAR